MTNNNTSSTNTRTNQVAGAILQVWSITAICNGLLAFSAESEVTNLERKGDIAQFACGVLIMGFFFQRGALHLWDPARGNPRGIPLAACAKSAATIVIASIMQKNMGESAFGYLGGPFHANSEAAAGAAEASLFLFTVAALITLSGSESKALHAVKQSASGLACCAAVMAFWHSAHQYSQSGIDDVSPDALVTNIEDVFTVVNAGMYAVGRALQTAPGISQDMLVAYKGWWKWARCGGATARVVPGTREQDAEMQDRDLDDPVAVVVEV